jgi:hypothetical protein
MSWRDDVREGIVRDSPYGSKQAEIAFYLLWSAFGSNARRCILDHIYQLRPGEPGALMQALLIGG